MNEEGSTKVYSSILEIKQAWKFSDGDEQNSSKNSVCEAENFFLTSIFCSVSHQHTELDR